MLLTRLLPRFGLALALFVSFDLAGVALTLLTDLAGFVDRVWETSALLGYTIWFVVGVFCGVFNYPFDDPESDAGRRAGVEALVATTAAAVVLAAVASLFWSANEGTEPVAPDHRGVTLTYLVTTVLTVAAARFVLFREEPAQVGTMPKLEARAPKYDDPKDLERALAPRGEIGAFTGDANEEFRPSGLWGTVGFALGVPVLLFLDVSFFVLGPFDVFDRWTDRLLTGSLLVGLGWGFAASRWETARTWLLAAHAPLLMGTVFYFFGLLPGALFAMFGAPEWLSENTPFAGFVLGFVLGLVALGGAFVELFEKWFGSGSVAEPSGVGHESARRATKRAARKAARKTGS